MYISACNLKLSHQRVFALRPRKVVQDYGYDSRLFAWIGLGLTLCNCYTNSTKWRCSCNPAKCHTLAYGTDQCPGRQLAMGDSVINARTIDTHLGLTVSTINTADMDSAIKDRAQYGRVKLFCTFSIGNIYYRLPQNAHCCMTKLVQGLPIQIANILSRSVLRWWFIDMHLCYKRAVCIPRLYKSPVGLMYSACRKLGLTECVYISRMRGTYMYIYVCMYCIVLFIILTRA